MERRLLLDVIVGQGAPVFELLAGKDQALLIWRDALLVLDLALDVIDGVGGFNLESDGLSGDCDLLVSCERVMWRARVLTSLDEDLHGE